MLLRDVLEGTGCGAELGLFAGLDVPSVCDDSRRVMPGSLFVALKPVSSSTQDGEAFIPDAIRKGASVIVVQRASAFLGKGSFPGVCFVGVDDPRTAFSRAVDNFFAAPSRKVRVLGVTGTNGKTTATYFLESIIKAAGKKSGVVGTVNCRVGSDVMPSRNTTPGILDNQMFLARLAGQGVEYAVMEVSSHGLDQGRVDLIDFRGAVFTNLTGDHLDAHGTMENYFQAKAKLFARLSPEAFAVVNIDDSWGRRLLGMTRARVLTYGIDAPADVSARIEDFTLDGMRFWVKFPGGEIFLDTHFIGRHNIYNILAAFAAGLGEGLDVKTIQQGIRSLECVPGRLERVDCGQDYFVFIDYAHTDDGLKNVLTCLKAVPHRRLIVVFGCGGDRDRTKRPRMGQVACELAEHSILTSDNPRSEDPDAIIAQIVPGFTRKTYEILPDREAAIGRALGLAKKNDIVLLAGKGHETVQVLKDRTMDLCERKIVTRILAGGK